MASLSSSSPSSSSSMKKNMEEEEEEKKLVSLKSFEGEIFQVDELVALQSETIKTMMNEGDGDTEFPVPNVKSKTLKRVIEYCEKHKHVDDASADAAAEELRAWDLEFVNSFNTDVLYHLLLASNYLEVKGLMDLIIQRAADLIKGKMPEEIRKTFGIKNDFPPGQEEEIRKENPWAFEIPAVADHTPISKEEHNNNDQDQDTTKVIEEKLEKLEIDDNQQDSKPVVVVDQED